MTVVVKLKDVVDHLEMVNDQSTAYLNKQTGELYFLTEEELLEIDDEEDNEDESDLDDEPEWQREARLQAREVTSSEDWLELPGSFEIHEYNIMAEFCRSLMDDALSDRLLQLIRGSGAFRRFRNAIAEIGLEQAWREFRASAFENIAIEWLAENQIAYARESISKEAIN